MLYIQEALTEAEHFRVTSYSVCLVLLCYYLMLCMDILSWKLVLISCYISHCILYVSII